MSERQSIAFSGPLHEQVHKVIRTRILAGEWEPREPLPGEAHLSLELGVSVGTVRKAMDQLTRDHIVVRERGRGTVVRGDAEQHSISAFRLCGLDGQPITPRIVLVGTRASPATASEATALKLRDHRGIAPQVLRLCREWRVEDHLLCRETIMVEQERFPRLHNDSDIGAETLFATYAETYRVKVHRVQWTIGSPPHVAMERGSRDPLPDATALCIRRTAMDAHGTPLEVCEQLVQLDSCLVQINR